MVNGVGGHHAPVGATDTWLTPPHILEQLGHFDLDPCAAPEPRPWATAPRHISEPDDGLSEDWAGRVWLNPPYNRNVIAAWLRRMALHNNGTALIFARFDTEAFQDWVFGAANAMLFLRGRLTFCSVDGNPGQYNGGAPSVLIAYGDDDTDILAQAQLRGRFVLLASTTQIVIAGRLQTCWQLVRNAMHRCGGEAPLSRLYALIEDDPKCATNNNVRAKIRQQVQREGFERVGPGVYRLKEAAA